MPALRGMLALAALVLTFLPGAARAQEAFTLDLSGRRVEIPIHRLGGTLYVALDDLSRGFAGRVEWLDPGERAAATFLDERLVFRRDLPFVESRGQLHQIPHAPRFEGGELFIPFSFIQQGLPAIFPERFDFEPETARLRGGPPGAEADPIEYVVAPGLTTLRFFFAGSSAPRMAADASLPHALVVHVEGAALPPAAATALRGLGLVDSVRVERDSSAGGRGAPAAGTQASAPAAAVEGTRHAERLVLFLREDAFLYQVARLEEPAGFEITLYAPASGVEAEAVLARTSGARAAGAPPPPVRGDRTGPPVDAPPPLVEAPLSANTPAETPLATETPQPRKERSGVRTIVVDAGHGGRDVGAVGPTGLFEKDVTLDVALALQKELEERGGLRVVLTRDRDVFVPLTGRTRMANEAGADLFISIHCNSARSSKGGGFETYFLSEAKTEDARRVAQMENSSLRFENPEIDPDQLGELNFILWDLAQNEYLREASALAELVQKGLADELKLRDRGVKQAGFWVLNGAYMPAILVETAFISNPGEERLLKSEDFQGRLVDGLADSVMEYVETYERKVAAAEVGA